MSKGWPLSLLNDELFEQLLGVCFATASWVSGSSLSRPLLHVLFSFFWKCCLWIGPRNVLIWLKIPKTNNKFVTENRPPPPTRKESSGIFQGATRCLSDRACFFDSGWWCILFTVDWQNFWISNVQKWSISVEQWRPPEAYEPIRYFRMNVIGCNWGYFQWTRPFGLWIWRVLSRWSFFFFLGGFSPLTRISIYGI